MPVTLTPITAATGITVGDADQILGETLRGIGEYRRVQRHIALQGLFADLAMYTFITKTTGTISLTAAESDFDVTDGSGLANFRAGNVDSAYLSGRRDELSVVSYAEAREDRYCGSDNEQTGIPYLIGFFGGASPLFTVNRLLDATRTLTINYRDVATPWTLPTSDTDDTQDSVVTNIPRDVALLTIPCGAVALCQYPNLENATASPRWQQYLTLRNVYSGRLGDGAQSVRRASLSELRNRWR